MKYQKRYNKFSYQTICRICLTQSTTRHSLTYPVRESDSESDISEITIQKALEVVTNQKVPLDDNYPNSVCGMCFEFLKISYDFVQQYKGSMEKLKEYFDDDVEQVIDNSRGQEHFQAEFPVKQKRQVPEQKGQVPEQKLQVSERKRRVPEPKHAPVEIFVGNEKFNIKDILIVEEDTEELPDFKGFLKNLGKAVSASFVKKDYQKPSLDEEEPSLVIEKIVQLEPAQKPTTAKHIKLKAKCAEKFPDSNILDYGLPIFDPSANDDSDKDFLLQENCNTEVYQNIEDLPENEKTALKSALNFNYKCPHCNKFMASLTRAKVHSRRCAKLVKSSSCHVCEKKFDSRKRLLLHLKQKHFSVAPKSVGLENFKCKICNRRLWSRGALSYHMQTHKGKTYICDQCSKPFYTSSSLKSHMQVHYREKTVVVCPICGKGFHYRGGLFYHMKIHLNERNLRCSYCPRGFYTTNSLKRHELTHTGARPYACQYCDKSFRSMGEVKKHNLQHTNEKPFKCRYCTAGFRQIYNKNVHMMTHRGQFQCPSCAKGFADEDILRFHLKTKHGIRNNTDANVAAEIDTPEEPQEFEDDTASQYIQIEGEVGTLQFDDEEYYITEYMEEAESQDASDVLVRQMNTGGSKGEVLVETVETFE